MKETRLTMGMPITIELCGERANQGALDTIFAFFAAVDERFSTYKSESEISRINRGERTEKEWSSDMREVFLIAENSKQKTNGYFDITRPDGLIDPSGVVKGWALQKAGDMLLALGVEHFMIDGAGDIATHGTNSDGMPWTVGIRSPFNRDEVVKVVQPAGKGVATSGSAIRGAHIYNPLAPDTELTEVVSVTVIAPDILTADLFATAAFAMGREGIAYLELHPDLEGYAIDQSGMAMSTSGFLSYAV